MQKRNVGNKTASSTVALIVGFSVEMVTFFLALTLFTVCINNEYLKLNASLIGGCIGHFASMLLGALAIGKVAADKKMLLVLLCGGVFLLVEISAVMLLFDGFSSTFVLNAVCVIAGVLAGIFVISKPQKRNGSKKYNSRR